MSAGSWNCTKKDYEKLDATLRQMFAIMVGLRVRPGENPETYRIRSRRQLKTMRQEAGLRSLSYEVKLLHFTWMGHVARIPTYDPHRLTPRVLAYRDMAYIKRRQRANGGNQCHGRHFHAWRLETAIYNLCGLGWQQLAADRSTWQASLENWAKDGTIF